MQTVCAGVDEPERRGEGVEELGRALDAALDARVLGERQSVFAVGGSWSLSCRGARQDRAPVSSAEAIVRRVLAQRLDARPQVGEQRGAVAEEGPDPRRGPGQGVERRRGLGDRLLDERPRDRGEGAEGGVEGDEHLRLGLGDRRHLGRGGRERAEEAASPVFGEARLRATGSSR